MTPQSPIVVLDSGLGGLTVVRALRNALPHEDILYFGDTARLPYGSKSAATVTAFVRQIIAYLLPRNPKHVVIACNTATALALNAVRQAFPGLTISGVVEPGAKAAVEAAGARDFPVIGVLATEATIKSKAYDHAIHRRRQRARLLLRPAPLLVPIIEEGRDPKTDPLVRLAIDQYVAPMVKHAMDVLVLGCTHYPILRDAIVDRVGPGVAVIDSADQCARDVARRLAAAGWLRAGASPMIGGSGMATGGRLSSFVTDDPARFQRLGGRFLGVAIDQPAWVSTDDLHAAEDALPGLAPTEQLRMPA